MTEASTEASGSVPSPGWCVELLGDPSDLEEWQYDLKQPFDPWLETFDHHAKKITALRSSAFDAVSMAEQAQAVGSAILEQLQGAFQILSGHRFNVNVGASLNVAADGEVRGTHFLRAEPAVSRVRLGRPTLTVYDADGRIIPPPPPQPSEAQRWTQAGIGTDNIADFLVHVGRANNWFDIFKALEVAEDLAGGGEKALAKLADQSLAEVKRLKRTANHYRHAGGPHTLPSDPFTLETAIPALRSIAKSVLEKLAA